MASKTGTKVGTFLWLTFLSLVIAPLLGLIILWCSLAITFADVSGQASRWALGSSFGIAFVAMFFCFPKRILTTILLFAAFAGVFYWWSDLKPSHDRVWSDLTSVLPTVRIEGDTASVQGIRNFEYQTASEFRQRYHDKTFDLTKLTSLDLIISYWDDGRHTAHSMLSFGFEDKDYLCVSVEARAEKDEEYSGLAGLFRKYELIYVLGDEADLIGSRTGVRKEQVYLYPTNTRRADIRKLFEKIMARVNQIAEKPEFYNTITDNCTTCLAHSGQSIVPPNSFDYRLLLNGYADEMAFENGWIKADENDSFDVVREDHHINKYIKNDFDIAHYSRRIRRYIPDQPVNPDDQPETQPAPPTTQPAPKE
jgi:hypothetical protein